MPRIDITEDLYTEPYEHGWTLYRRRKKDPSKIREGKKAYVWDQSWHTNLEQTLMRALTHSTEDCDSLEAVLEAIKQRKQEIVDALDRLKEK